MTHEPQPVFNLYEPSDDRRNVVDCVQQFVRKVLIMLII